MKKIIIQYDEVSGSVYDINGTYIFAWSNLSYDEPSNNSSTSKDNTSKIIELRNAGFTFDETMSLIESRCI